MDRSDPRDSGRLALLRSSGLSIGSDELEVRAATPAAVGVGDRVGDYLLDSCLWAGKQSLIFAAVDRVSHRRLAVKLLKPELSLDSEALAQIEAEAALASTVKHPAVVPAFDLERDGDYAFFTQNLQTGDSLESLRCLAVGQREESFFVDLATRFASVVEAVAGLHERGIVHRDIAPRNVLIDFEGLFLLTDFGSALDSEAPRIDSQPGLGGSLYYASPEQLTPDADRFDPKADVYALGITLYELLTGVAAFPPRKGDELARWKLTRRPPAARRANCHVPLGLEAILRQAIELDRSQRYDDAGAMAHDLRRFVSSKLGHQRRYRETP